MGECDRGKTRPATVTKTLWPEGGPNKSINSGPNQIVKRTHRLLLHMGASEVGAIQKLRARKCGVDEKSYSGYCGYGICQRAITDQRVGKSMFLCDIYC